MSNIKDKQEELNAFSSKWVETENCVSRVLVQRKVLDTYLSRVRQAIIVLPLIKADLLRRAVIDCYFLKWESKWQPFSIQRFFEIDINFIYGYLARSYELQSKQWQWNIIKLM